MEFSIQEGAQDVTREKNSPIKRGKGRVKLIKWNISSLKDTSPARKSNQRSGTGIFLFLKLPDSEIDIKC